MDDRLALRFGALRLARRRGSVRDVVWAASRLRLRGVAVDAADTRLARDMSIRFGRALRVARVRRPNAPTSEITILAPPPLLTPAHSRRRTVRAALATAGLLAVLLLVLWVLLLRGPSAPADTSGSTPAAPGAAVPTASPLRGRSQVLLAIVPTGTLPPSGAPTAQTSAAPTIDPDDRVRAHPQGSPGSGGSGAGGGSGGGGSGSSGASTPSPTPTIDPAHLMHLQGHVYDVVTKQGAPGVCVFIGSITCDRSPHTDSTGFWSVDLIIGNELAWDLKFLKAGYFDGEVSVPSRPGTYTVDDILFRPNGR